MTTSSWTSEPWELEAPSKGYQGYIVHGGPSWEELAMVPVYPPDRPSGNAARIVACVNALAGMNPEGVVAVVDALRRVVVALGRPQDTWGMDAARLACSDALAGIRSQVQR